MCACVGERQRHSYATEKNAVFHPICQQQMTSGLLKSPANCSLENNRSLLLAYLEVCG